MYFVLPCIAGRSDLSLLKGSAGLSVLRTCWFHGEAGTAGFHT